MNRILIIQLSRLGDLLQSLPLVKRLKEAYPHSQISLACARELSLIAGCSPSVDRLITIPVADIVPLDTKEILILEEPHFSQLERVFGIREFHEEYDLVINLTHNLIGALICGLTRSGRKAGRADDGKGRSVVFGRWAQYFFAMASDRRQNLFNIVDIYLGMGEAPHGAVQDYFILPPKAEEDALELLVANGSSQTGHRIALQLGASNPNRVWPLTNFVAVANALARHPGLEIVLLGSASEQPAANRFLHQAEFPVINLVGKTDLAQLTGVIKGCELMIANDTGPLHLAAAVGTRVLGLYFCSGHFSETAPYGPREMVIQAEPPCSPCHEGQGCETLSCRDDLKAEAVIDAAEMVLFGKEKTSFQYPNLALYQSRFLSNGTIIYHPMSRTISQQYQTGYLNRRMFEAAFDLGHDPRFDDEFLPRFLAADGLGDRIERLRNILAPLQRCFQQALKTTHGINRELMAEPVNQARAQSLIKDLRQLEDNIVVSEPSIAKNIHALEMMAVGSTKASEFFHQLIPRYSRLYGLTVSSLAALEALSSELDLLQSQQGIKAEASSTVIDNILYLGLSSGQNFGWGICGDYLTRELSKRVKTIPLGTNGELQNNRQIPGKVFHTLKATDLSTLFPARGTHNFGYTFFENELLPQSLRNAKDYDLVFAGSTWCKERLSEAGINHVEVLIQGVDREVFFPITEEKGQDRFVIFSGGKFELRKGQDLVLRAIKVLQAKYPDIVLANVWYNKWPQTMQLMGLSPHIRFQLKGNSWNELMEHVYIINGIDPGRVVTYPIVSNRQLRSLYQQTDLGLFPNRCEGGTNLVLMEYMACAKPVIAAYTSGHKDILTNNNSLMLNHMRKFPVYDQQKRLVASWDEPSLDEIIAAIEYAYHHRDEMKAIGRQAGEDLKEFTWEGAAAKVFEAIFG